MMPRLAAFPFLATLLLAAPAAVAQQVLPEKCGGRESGLTPELSSWASRTTLHAAAGRASIPEAELKIGQAYTVALQPMAQIEFLSPPEKTGTSEASGGLFEINVTESGTYSVALGASAWVDVVVDGAGIASTGHGHGPECSTIRKIVHFPLKRGRHAVQIAGSPAAEITIMVAKKP